MLDWDAETHCCSTTSLHYLEGDSALRQGRTSFPQGPQVVTDPQVSTPSLQTAKVHHVLGSARGTPVTP